MGSERFAFPTPSRNHFLLTGWALNFTNGEHQIRSIGINRQGDDIEAFYSDQNADDPFDWRIEWAHIGPVVFAPPT